MYLRIDLRGLSHATADVHEECSYAGEKLQCSSQARSITRTGHAPIACVKDTLEQIVFVIVAGNHAVSGVRGGGRTILTAACLKNW